eukprot:5097330-Amphidinium_carterae.1
MGSAQGTRLPPENHLPPQALLSGGFGDGASTNQYDPENTDLEKDPSPIPMAQEQSQIVMDVFGKYFSDIDNMSQSQLLERTRGTRGSCIIVSEDVQMNALTIASSRLVGMLESHNLCSIEGPPLAGVPIVQNLHVQEPSVPCPDSSVTAEQQDGKKPRLWMEAPVQGPQFLGTTETTPLHEAEWNLFQYADLPTQAARVQGTILQQLMNMAKNQESRMCARDLADSLVT